ncbi:MAG: hypothetical protein J5653_02350 [Clostridiales bacterium]|nr:hypothetical protein [Clostridiales bacterium]
MGNVDDVSAREPGPEIALCKKNSSGFLDRNVIKYLMVLLMVVDHVAFCFMEHIPSPSCEIMRFFGRCVAPVFAFFIAEGFMHTSDVKKFRRRIGILAIVSYLPSVFCFIGIEEIKSSPAELVAQTVIVSFYLALVALSVWYSEKMKKRTKIILIVLLTLASVVTDMPVAGVLAPFFHCVFRDNKKKRYIAVALSYVAFVAPMIAMQGWSTAGVLLAPLLLIFCYNGEGGTKNAFNKWFFYVFYPLHILILGILRWYVI